MPWSVRAARPRDLEALPPLVGRLGDWFDETGRRNIPIDARFKRVVAVAAHVVDGHAHGVGKVT